MLEGIVLGIMGGILYGCTGYLKSIKKRKREKFDILKFTQSVVVGGIVGGITYSMGISMASAQQLVFNTGLVTIIENVKKYIWRRFISK